MKAVSAADVWIVRLVRVAALLTAGAAVLVWVTPVNALGRNLVPVGCGTPSSPLTEPLIDFVCADHIANARSNSLALLIAAGALLALSELVLPRGGTGRPWVRATAATATVALPVVALSVATLFSTIAGEAADGTLIRCGTPVAPSTDPISRSVCGQVAARDKTLGLGGVGLSVLLLLGSAYIGKGRDEPARADDVVPVPDADEAEPSTALGTATDTDSTPDDITKDRP